MLVILYEQCDVCQANANKKRGSLSWVETSTIPKHVQWMCVSKILSKESPLCLQRQFGLFELNLL